MKLSFRWANQGGDKIILTASWFAWSPALNEAPDVPLKYLTQYFSWSLNNVEVCLFYLFFFPLAFFAFVVDPDLSLLIGGLFEVVSSSWLELDQQLKITVRLLQFCCSSLEQIILVPLARGTVQPGLGGWRCVIAHIPISQDCTHFCTLFCKPLPLLSKISISFQFIMWFIYYHQLVVLFTFCCVPILQNDGTLLATGSYDGQARIWSPEGTTVNCMHSIN